MNLRNLLAAVAVALLVASGAEAGIGMKAPDISNDTWLNGAPTSFAELKGRVVLVEFWTFG